MKAVSDALRVADRLPHAMAGYIRWLAPQMSRLPGLLLETFEGARARATSTAGPGHLRSPEALAQLWVGLHAALTYAEEIGACSAAEAEDLREKSWEAMLESGHAQGQLVVDERPVRRFLRTLQDLVLQGRARLVPRDRADDVEPGGPDLLGWYDDAALYLLPEAAWHAVARRYRETGDLFPVRVQRLQHDMREDGLSECDAGRHTKVNKVGGRPHRLLMLRRSKLDALLEGPFVIPLPQVTAVTDPGW